MRKRNGKGGREVVMEEEERKWRNRNGGEGVIELSYCLSVILHYLTNFTIRKLLLLFARGYICLTDP